MLDQIMMRTSEIISAASDLTSNKHEIFINALQDITDDLSDIVKISSRV
jgi:hypothetical protein